MDQIIERVGNFGIFQALVFTATSSTIMTSTWVMLFMAFGNYNPGWSCANQSLSNPMDASPSVTTSSTTANATPHIRGRHDCDVWRKCDRIVFDQDSSTIVTEWNLLCDHSWVQSLVITVQMCGVMVGACMCGPIGDRIGRRVSLYGSLGLQGVASLVGAFSTNWQMFAATRFFMGAAAGGILTSAFVYPLEFVGNQWRPVLGSFPTWSLGAVIFAFVAFVLRDWRNIHIATSVVSVVCFLPAFWMPESMRWLVLNDRVNEIKSTVQRIASWNKKAALDPEFVDEIIRDIGETKYAIRKPGYIDLFRTSRLRKYSLKFGFIWISMACIYYTISFGVKSFSGDFYTNLILFALTEIPGLVFVPFMSNRFGRRLTTNVFLGLCALSCFGIVVFTFVPGVNNSAISVVLATLAKMAVFTAWALIIVMAAELYPTVVRNLQSGFLNTLARLGAILSSYMIPSDEESLFITYIANGVLMLIALVLVASLSESKGRPMTDAIDEPVQRTREMFVNTEKLLKENSCIGQDTPEN